MKRYEEAAGYFRRLVRIFKTNLNVREALCYALQELGNESHAQGRYLMAEACFEEALENQSENAAYLYNLGNVQRELGQLDLAITSYQKALDLNPKLYHAKVHLVHQKQQYTKLSAGNWQASRLGIWPTGRLRSLG